MILLWDNSLGWLVVAVDALNKKNTSLESINQVFLKKKPTSKEFLKNKKWL